jgi:ABC-2 type transport system permease protein
VITLAVPALMAAVAAIMIVIAAKSSASTNVRHIRILDATATSLGERISQNLMADSGATADGVKPVVEHVSVADLPALQDRATADVVTKGGLAGYLVLTDSTLRGQTFYYAGRNASSVADIERLRTAVRQSVSVVRLQREGLTDSVVSAFNNMPLKMRSERITDSGRGGSGQAGIVAGLIVGVLLFMSIIIHGQNVLRGVLEEKSSRVAEVVISSIKPEALLAGKVLGVGAVGLTQQVAWLAIGAYLSNFILPVIMKNLGSGAGVASAAGAAAGASPIAGALGGMTPAVIGVAFVFFLVGFTFYAALYAAAGSMVNSEQEAQQAAVPVMLLIMSAWLMVNPVLINPNSRLAVVMSWLPWSSPIIMPMRMGLTSVPPIEVAGSILVAIVGCIGAVWLSARIYRIGMLMYGKKPSFAEVAKWIRYA